MKKKVLFISFIISFIYLLFATKSSFLYPINDWVDANAFFTMGKGMAKGLVPFKDLFEQKGPLLYFYHMIAYFISNKTFLGVFILEVISFTITLYYSYKILSMYLKENISLLLMPIYAALLLSNPSFRYGDSAEEFIMPMLVYSLYNYLLYIKNKKLSKKDYIINGILAGFTLWIKYTMIGFWFIWMLTILIDHIINKKIKDGIINSLYFLLGMFISTLPWIIYFGINNAIKDWINVYFLINLKSYSIHTSFLVKVLTPFKIFIHNISKYPVVFFLILLGEISILFTNIYTDNKKYKVNLFLLLIFLIFTVYIGGFGYLYYFYIFIPFILFGMITLVKLLNININKYYFLTYLSVFTLSFTLMFKYNLNTKDLNKNKNDYPQYYFLKEIEKEENKTLLNYGFIDGGFYLTSGITPNVKYFEKLNLKYENYKENIDEQNRYIKEKKTKFVVLKVKKHTKINVPYLYENYELVSTFETKKHTYLLFKS